MKMTADTVGISRGVSRTERLLGQLTKSTKQATSAMRGLVAIEVGKILANGFMAAYNSLSGFVSSLRQSIDATAKLAARTGIAVESLQALQVAAGLSGVNNLEGALQRVTIAIGDAAQGNQTAIDAFERLGISFDNLAGMSPDEQFRAIAAAISALPTQAERAAAAADLFGRTGVELLPMFESNLAAIEERAERLGIVLSADQTASIEEMNDALSLVYQTFTGIIGQVTANLAPAVTAIAEEFLRFVEGYNGLDGEVGGNAFADAITEALFSGARVLASVFDFVVEQFSGFGSTMEGVGSVFTTAGDILYRVGQWFAGVFNQARISLNGWLKLVADVFAEILSYVPGAGDFANFARAFSENLQINIDRDTERRNQNIENLLNGAPEPAEQQGGGIAGRFVDDMEARFRAMQAARGERPDRPDPRPQVQPLEMAVEETDKNLDKIRQLNEQYAEKAEEIERDRLDALGRANQQALEATDIRSGGISQILALATGREDPAVEAARAQQRELENISREIRKLGGTVELVGAA